MPFRNFRKHTKPSRWEALPPAESKFNSSCPNCGMMSQTLPMDSVIAVGFGQANITRDNAMIYFESRLDEEYPTAQQAEEIAAQNPDHDWRITYHGPLSDKQYQRQGPGRWVLVATGRGFA